MIRAADGSDGMSRPMTEQELAEARLGDVFAKPSSWVAEPLVVWAVFANGKLNSLWAEHSKAEAHAFEVARINGPAVVMVIERVEVRS